MGWLHLVVVALVLLGTGHARGRRRGSRGRVESVPAGSSDRWYQEGRVSRALLHQPYIQKRPVVNGSVPVKVGHSLSLIAISDYQPVSHIVTFRAHVRQVWVDTRLSWDSADGATIDKLHLRSDEIWTPETEVFPSLDDKDYVSHDRHDVIVTSAGAVTWAYDVTYRLPCVSAGANQLSCSMRVWTPMYEANEVVVGSTSDVIKTADYVTETSCKVLETRAEQELLSRMPELFSVVRYSFIFNASAYLD